MSRGTPSSVRGGVGTPSAGSLRWKPLSSPELSVGSGGDPEGHRGRGAWRRRLRSRCVQHRAHAPPCHLTGPHPLQDPPDAVTLRVYRHQTGQLCHARSVFGVTREKPALNGRARSRRGVGDRPGDEALLAPVRHLLRSGSRPAPGGPAHVQKHMLSREPQRDLVFGHLVTLQRRPSFSAEGVAGRVPGSPRPSSRLQDEGAGDR